MNIMEEISEILASDIKLNTTDKYYMFYSLPRAFIWDD